MARLYRLLIVAARSYREGTTTYQIERVDLAQRKSLSPCSPPISDHGRKPMQKDESGRTTGADRRSTVQAGRFDFLRSNEAFKRGDFTSDDYRWSKQAF